MAQMSRVVSTADFQRRRVIAPRRPARFHSRKFGRRKRLIAKAEPVKKTAVSDDLRLFAATFAGGFLFVSVLIA